MWPDVRIRAILHFGQKMDEDLPQTRHDSSGAIFANLPRTSRHRRQGTFIDGNGTTKGLQHLGNKPNTLIVLVMHDGPVVATGRTLSGAGAGAGAGAPRPLP